MLHVLIQTMSEWTFICPMDRVIVWFVNRYKICEVYLKKVVYHFLRLFIIMLEIQISLHN